MTDEQELKGQGKRKPSRRNAARKTKSRSRANILRRVYARFIASLAKDACDIAFAGPDPQNDANAVWYCFTHNKQWMSDAASKQDACPGVEK